MVQFGILGLGPWITFPRVSTGSPIDQYWPSVTVRGPRLPAFEADAAHFANHCLIRDSLAVVMIMSFVFHTSVSSPAKITSCGIVTTLWLPVPSFHSPNAIVLDRPSTTAATLTGGTFDAPLWWNSPLGAPTFVASNSRLEPIDAK